MKRTLFENLYFLLMLLSLALIISTLVFDCTLLAAIISCFITGIFAIITKQWFGLIWFLSMGFLVFSYIKTF